MLDLPRHCTEGRVATLLLQNDFRQGTRVGIPNSYQVGTYPGRSTRTRVPSTRVPVKFTKGGKFTIGNVFLSPSDRVLGTESCYGI